MIDLTPLDVRKKRGDFRKILRGYDPGEVDSFLEMVGSRFETLVMENLSLTEKAERLASQLEALEGREKAVQEALVTAQKLREDVQDQSAREAESLRIQAQQEADSLKDQALRESESIRGDAHREASILRDEAIREAAAVRDEARREFDILRKETIGEIEARILEADGLIKERRRALEELERSRLKFLKGFRSLLEREMDSVEVEESRRPLDDTPLELNFKSWSSSEGKVEAADGAWDESPGEGGGAEETVSPVGYEPVIDLGSPEAESPEVADVPRGWGAMPGDEPPEGEFSDIVPVGVFDPAAHPNPAVEAGELNEGLEDVQDGSEQLTTDEEIGPVVDEEDGAEDGRAGRDSQPRWLFSLLREQKEAGSDVGESVSKGAEERAPDPDPSGMGWEKEDDPDGTEPRID